MATSNEMIDLLFCAREMIRINSGALAKVGNSMNIMESIRPDLYANAEMCAEIAKMIEEFYTDEA